MKIKAATVVCANVLRCQRGDVMMEYVILLVAIVLPLVVADKALFNPGGDYEGKFGVFGESYHGFYTNLVDNISQPVP